ncbi:MAG: ABC transporter permease [Thermoprotei archaeon]|nr:MAG: ABC transporter permease [Thermoprotei archaeon]
MVIEGINPIIAYASLLQGAFGGFYEIGETMAKAAPIMLTGLAATIAFKCRVWNIGGEGQLYVGAVAATWIGLSIYMHPAVEIPLILIISFLAGALYGLIPGLLKAYFKVNEIVLTLMLNYIAILFVSFLVEGPWRDPSGITYSPPIAETAYLPVLIPRTRLHLGVILAVLCAIALHLVLHRTIFGYEVTIVGANPEAAKCKGINIPRTIVLTMLISGGLAGLAGMGEVCGIQHRLMGGLSPGYGFFGVIAALLGKLEPLGVLFSSILLGAIFVGADAMQRAAGVSVTIVYMLESFILLFLIACDRIFPYILKKWVGKE